MTIRKIWIDAGHGGSDPGACANGLKEKNMTLVTALEFGKQLTANGFIVSYTRTSDKTVELDDRGPLANEWGAELFVAIHYNAGKGDGYDIIHSILGGTGKKLAMLVAEELRKLGQNPHGTGVWSRKGSDGHDYYAVIRETSMPAIIIEPCFIDSGDVAFANTVTKQKAIAVAYCKAVCRLAGVTYHPPIDYQREIIRVLVGGEQKIALTGYTKTVEWAKANCKGKHVILECKSDKKRWDLGIIPTK